MNEKPQGKVVGATGFEPVAGTTKFHATVEPQFVLISTDLPQQEGSKKFRPLSSPTPRRLSRLDLRYLMSVLNREIRYCGLDTSPGRRALELRDKLVAIHAEGDA